MFACSIFQFKFLVRARFPHVACKLSRVSGALHLWGKHLFPLLFGPLHPFFDFIKCSENGPMILPVPFKLHSPRLRSDCFPYQSRQSRSLFVCKLSQSFILWDRNTYRYDSVFDHFILSFYETVKHSPNIAHATTKRKFPKQHPHFFFVDIPRPVHYVTAPKGERREAEQPRSTRLFAFIPPNIQPLVTCFPKGERREAEQPLSICLLFLFR